MQALVDLGRVAGRGPATPGAGTGLVQPPAAPPSCGAGTRRHREQQPAAAGRPARRACAQRCAHHRRPASSDLRHLHRAVGQPAAGLVTGSQLDLRPGDRWLVAFQVPDGPAFREERVITSVERPHRLAYDMTAVYSDAPSFSTTVEVIIEAVPDGQRVRLVQQVSPRWRPATTSRARGRTYSANWPAGCPHDGHTRWPRPRDRSCQTRCVGCRLGQT
jgi:uncharacterized protein YndB with AHSA1/START domain